MAIWRRREALLAALAQQREELARLRAQYAALSRLRLPEGSAEDVAAPVTASVADGLDAEFRINMKLDSDGEEMTQSPSN